MNIDKIKEIVNSTMPEDAKRHFIIQVLAQDKKVIPTMMEILEEERTQTKELITDMNLELSRADVHIQNPTLGHGEVKSTTKDKVKIEEIKKAQAKEFVLNHITAFYVKYKGRITHCFNKQV